MQTRLAKRRLMVDIRHSRQPDVRPNEISFQHIVEIVSYGAILPYLDPLDVSNLASVSPSIAKECSRAIKQQRQRQSHQFTHQLPYLNDQIDNWLKYPTIRETFVLRSVYNDFFLLHPDCTLLQACDYFKEGLFYEDDWPLLFDCLEQDFIPGLNRRLLADSISDFPVMICHYSYDYVKMDSPGCITGQQPLAGLLKRRSQFTLSGSVYGIGAADKLWVTGVALYDWDQHADHSVVVVMGHDQVQRLLHPFSVTALRSPDPIANRFPHIARYLFSGQTWVWNYHHIFDHEWDPVSMRCLFHRLNSWICNKGTDSEQNLDADVDADLRFPSLFESLTTENGIIIMIEFVDGLFVLDMDYSLVFFHSLYALFAFADWYCETKCSDDHDLVTALQEITESGK